jgi:DNA topoisomerase II
MSNKYDKIDQIDHIHLRPDMYVGSLKSKKENNEWISNSNATLIKKINSIKYSEGLLRIFIEAISNSIDNVWRSSNTNTPCKNIKICINKDTGVTSIYNDGLCIPIQINDKTQLYNPELIFGHLLTSSNYDDSKDRYTSGRNGLGIKLTNVFSKEFNIDIMDGNKRFTKRWYNNMRDSDKEVITNCKKKGNTFVSWVPDFEKFKMTGYDNNIIKVFNKIVLDTAMITKVNVFLNDEKIQIKSLLDYSKLYNNQIDSISMRSKDCEVVLTINDDHDEYEYIAFTNGVFNKDGGVHVNRWTEDIFRPILNKLNKPNKPHINMKDVKKFFRIFINAVVKNPEFTSQSKTYLSHPEITTNVTANNISNIMKWDILNNIKDIIRGKEMLTLKKTENKSRKFKKIDGLDPANNASSKYSKDCTLILCEGLSAKTYAVGGIQIGWNGMKGRDWFGAYALRGKLLNVRNASLKMISNNKEITDLVNALNLKYDTDYTQEENFNTLNYGKVMIMTDADHDGIHIASLIMNLFHFLFPSLLSRQESFIVSMQTPIVKILNKDLVFYREEHYQKYISENKDNKLKIKYYKGLGTSSDKEIKDTFGKYVIKFSEDNNTDKFMNLVFNNKQADDRKKWMTKYDKSYIPENVNNMTITDYLDKEQIKFSLNDCGRSLPNIYDGMKESHRKIMYGIFLKNCKDSIKVAQLAGFVAEKTNYHHGEQNLFETITKLAQDFVGSNNISYLQKDGQFGTRLLGGKDAANARYIFTKLSKITRLLFPKYDDTLLDYVYDEGEKVEPKYYLPILPTILVNGCKAGIGTGWSTSIPCYNPKDLITFIKNHLNDKPTNIELNPWYKGFTGTIKKVSKFNYESEGIYERKDKKVIITELPVMTWTDKYKEFLETLLENKKIKGFKNYSTPDKVHFQINPGEMVINKNTLKLVGSISTSNMVLFMDNSKLKKFKTIYDVVYHFINKRFEMYVKRKQHILINLLNKLKDLQVMLKFITLVVNKKLIIFEREEHNIYNDLDRYKFDKKDNSYDYLLNLNIRKFSKTQIQKLNGDIREVGKDISIIEGKTEKDMWIEELDQLEKEL